MILTAICVDNRKHKMQGLGKRLRIPRSEDRMARQMFRKHKDASQPKAKLLDEGTKE